ncbi:hypothetical protein KFL_000490080 [Klebsormidium nitens]|uniref:Cationic amino acid transporter C-terminal domain-containing protein n=1 Tax=Klebsormidium nitens TaxID=105231 RepID=A0A0U9HI66_KLENI|nr:hypothetical protein KFL_000490080 [Klebsormidium nitens]|eukprot:GAQ80218.1 hypothetical protein KFL_000490080 [Klebsormidium nitens]
MLRKMASSAAIADGMGGLSTPTPMPGGGQSQQTVLGGLFRRKASDSHHRISQIPRVLTFIHLLPVGVGATIGAGVYVLVGAAARERAGPALTLSFLLAGIAAALAALCYAEQASRCPSAGSAYHYAYTCVGEAVAWIVGWGLILEYGVGAAAVARGIAPNLATFAGGYDNLPWILHRIPVFDTGVELDPVAALMVVLVTVLLCYGIKESVTVQGVLVVMNGVVLSFVVVAGVVAGSRSGWEGYKQPGGYAPYGINGVFGGAAMVFFAYIGFDAVAATAEEVKKPQRDLPLGIGLSLLICGALYMAVAAVLVGLVPYHDINVDTPISSAFAAHGMPWAQYIVAGGALAALSTTLIGSLLPQPRVLMAMARDGLLPRWFSRLDPVNGTPTNATIVSGLVAAAMAFAMNIDELSGMVSVGTLLAFSVVSASVLILRYVPPEPPASTSTYTSPDPSVHDADLIAAAAVLNPPVSGGSAPHPPRPPLLHHRSLSEERLVTKDPLLGALQNLGNPPEGVPVLEGVRVLTRIGSAELRASMGSKEDAKRRQRAAWAISALSVSAPVMCLGAAGDGMPPWLRWVLGGLGLPSFLGSYLVLLLLPEDEGALTFGHAGGFQCPFVPTLPVASVAINVYFMVNLGLATWLRVGGWLLMGALIYALYGYQNSALGPPKGETELKTLGPRRRSWIGDLGYRWFSRSFAYLPQVNQDTEA